MYESGWAILASRRVQGKSQTKRSDDYSNLFLSNVVVVDESVQNLHGNLTLKCDVMHRHQSIAPNERGECEESLEESKS
jgi:hypothetical protein